MLASSPLVLVAAPQLNVKTVQGLIEFGKAHPEGLNFASAGVGTTPHLAGEMLKQRAGLNATHVPYRGIAAAYTDLMTNKIQFAFSSIAGALPFTADNRVVALSTSGDTRVSVYPEKPTMQEAGLKDFSVDLWLAVFAPQGMPAGVSAKLQAALQKSLVDSELKTAFANVGATPRGTSPEEAAAIVKSEYEKWKKIIIDENIAEK
jgi:tripartite-type tricarboxylate transporter receptor subunit TctC